MKYLLYLILVLSLVTACGDRFDQNTDLENSCFHECSFLISSDEPGEYNVYTCNGDDLTDQLYLTEPIGLFGDLILCSGPGFHFRALIGIDSYDGAGSEEFNNWYNATISDDCLNISLPAAQYNHVIQLGIELHAIIEITDNGSSSELDNVSPPEMQSLVDTYRQQLCN